MWKRLVALAIILALSFATTVVYSEQPPWDCPNCNRTGNLGNFCGSCAYPAPWRELEIVTVTNDGESERESGSVSDDPQKSTIEVPSVTNDNDDSWS